MTYLSIDPNASRLAYLRYVANKSGSKVDGHRLIFDEKANHHKAIEIVMDDGVFGFSNQKVDGHELPALLVFYLNYHEDGMFKLFNHLVEINCLVVRVNALARGDINQILEQDKLLRKIIGE
jgi:hypothetical protein